VRFGLPSFTPTLSRRSSAVADVMDAVLLVERRHRFGPHHLAARGADRSSMRHCLKEQVCEHYPDSEFAPNYGGFVQ
jgi:hypothetical protein